MKRSKKCEKGKHVLPKDGQTYTPGDRCAGYAGTAPCECPCHAKEVRA
jgi:hypothetical protein